MPANATAEPVSEAALQEALPEVFRRLNLPDDLQAEFLTQPSPAAGKPAAPAQGAPAAEGEPASPAAPAGEGEAEAATAEQARLQALAEETGKTVEEIQAEEAESARLEAKAAETGKTVEEIKAEEGAAAGKDSPEQQLATTKAELETAQARVAELETELKTRGIKPVEITAAALHPVLCADSEADIAKLDADFARFEKWALAHWDGTEAVEGKDGQPGTPAYTAEQIRARYSDVKEQRAQLIPLAQKSLATRRSYEAEAKAAYPELFDAKKPEAQLLKQVLAQAPGLKVIFPNIHMVFGDAIRGEKARQAEAAKKGKPAVPARVAPKIAVRPAPGAGSPIAGGKPKPAASPLSIDKFHERGGDRDALVATIMEAGIV